MGEEEEEGGCRSLGWEEERAGLSSPVRLSVMQPQVARSPVQVRCAAGAEVHCGSGGSFRPIRGAGGEGGVGGLHAQPVQGNSFTQAGRCS